MDSAPHPLFKIMLIAVAATLLLVTPNASAISYVGLGGGLAPQIDTRLITHYTAGPETVKFSMGSSFEAQFGWEAAPWIDMEGALRYHGFSRTDTLRTDRETVSGLDVIAAEGGIRLHPRRGWSNSGPYIRGGLGSFSPTVSLDKGDGSVNGDPVLGYYFGAGYLYEVSSSWGLDIRATYLRARAFNKDVDGRNLQLGSLAVTLSVIIF